jgi:hypothetical protein
VDFVEGYQTLTLEEVEEFLVDHVDGGDDEDLKEEDVKMKKEESEDNFNGATGNNAFERNWKDRAMGDDDSGTDGVTRE